MTTMVDQILAIVDKHIAGAERNKNAPLYKNGVPMNILIQDMQEMRAEIEVLPLREAPVPSEEPVAWQRFSERLGWTNVDASYAVKLAEAGEKVRPLYAAPQRMEASAGVLTKARALLDSLLSPGVGDVGEHILEQDARTLAEAIAAPVAPVAVSVKELEWVETSPGIHYAWCGIGLMDCYTVVASADRVTWKFNGGDYQEPAAPTTKSGKAAAQSDFNARILSSIIPATKGGEDAWREKNKLALVTDAMVNAAWNKAKALRMTGLPREFRLVLEAALVARQSIWTEQEVKRVSRRAIDLWRDGSDIETIESPDILQGNIEAAVRAALVIPDAYKQACDALVLQLREETARRGKSEAALPAQDTDGVART